MDADGPFSDGSRFCFTFFPLPLSNAHLAICADSASVALIRQI